MSISKLHIRTFGCQMNEYDSNKMRDVLKASHNLDLTEDINEADVLLINTCSIREKAEDKLFHQLGRWRKLKEKNPNLVIGVGGCVASQEGDLILKRAPYVDMIFGPQTLHRLPNMLNEALMKMRLLLIFHFQKLKNLIICLSPIVMAHQPLSQLWRGAVNIVLFVLFLIPGEKKFQDHL